MAAEADVAATAAARIAPAPPPEALSLTALSLGALSDLRGRSFCRPECGEPQLAGAPAGLPSLLPFESARTWPRLEWTSGA